MTNFKDEITKLLQKETGLKEIPLERPKQESHGDFAFPCFVVAKKEGKNPAEVAKDLAANLKLPKSVESAIAVGPFLNFRVNKSMQAEAVLKKVFHEKENFGKGSKKKEKLMVEYCQVNTHKSFHVGHLRGTLLGSSLIKILKFSGYKVIAANYQGDIGAHVAKAIWYLNKYNEEEYPKTQKGRWMGQIYQRANAKLNNAGEKEEQYKKEVSEVLQKLEAEDPEFLTIWKETREWCLEDYEEFYKTIGVFFDEYFFESEVEKPGKEIVKELVKKKLAFEDDGALIVDLKEHNLGVFLVLKQDGTALYATKDLALAKRKFEEFKIDKNIYVVGSEQKFYFQQLFKTLDLMGFKHAKDSVHVSYELVTLEGGKISSREGELIYAEELVDQLYSAAEHAVKERHTDWSEEEVKTSATNVSLGALKFSFLNQDNNKNITFHQERALDFEGETGPYVQYAHARIHSILRKSEITISESVDFSEFNHPSEHRLITAIEQFSAVVEKSGESYQPQIITTYVFNLARSFNEFYRDCPILKEKESVKLARLFLIDQVRQVLANALGLLGIHAPEQM